MTTLLSLLIAAAVFAFAYRLVRREPVSSLLLEQFRPSDLLRDSDPGYYDDQRQYRDIAAARSVEDEPRAA
ncbi:hypothetical protein IU418_21665 [Nocardia farcinica]|uniref:hypothetical protein n=1 Tax=Nocardia farcinica TaxID=37329 RepID=UPI001B3C55CE|nr:hypothetical protein [Nocardia farcinica]MBF6539817.1 hypothetical protein [Nocardia farcinica]